jgi:hypothetical protein
MVLQQQTEPLMALVVVVDRAAQMLRGLDSPLRMLIAQTLRAFLVCMAVALAVLTS